MHWSCMSVYDSLCLSQGVFVKREKVATGECMKATRFVYLYTTKRQREPIVKSESYKARFWLVKSSLRSSNPFWYVKMPLTILPGTSSGVFFFIFQVSFLKCFPFFLYYSSRVPHSLPSPPWPSSCLWKHYYQAIYIIFLWILESTSREKKKMSRSSSPFIMQMWSYSNFKTQKIKKHFKLQKLGH